MKKVVVVGGGAAGLMAAIAAAESGAKVTLLERNKQENTGHWQWTLQSDEHRSEPDPLPDLRAGLPGTGVGPGRHTGYIE